MEAIGTASANEALDVTAKLSNRITAIRFREGQQVKAGDVLVEFDSGEEENADVDFSKNEGSSCQSDDRGESCVVLPLPCLSSQ